MPRIGPPRRSALEAAVSVCPDFRLTRIARVRCGHAPTEPPDRQVVTIDVENDGRPFNPLDVPPTDLDVPIEDRPIRRPRRVPGAVDDGHVR